MERRLLRNRYHMPFCCYNSQKQLARNGVKGVIVSTENVKARPETVLIDANSVYVVVTYDTIYDALLGHCLLYTSDAADDLLCVDLGGRRNIKKKKNKDTER